MVAFGAALSAVGLIALRKLRLGNRLALLAAAWIAISGHLGTSQVVLEGNAGPFPIRVFIRPPGVVPAQVPIVVRVLSGTPTRVTVRAAQWNVGTKGAPPAEEAHAVAGEAGTYSHDLWIMTSSAYAVHVEVEGAAGKGTLVVPMQSLQTRTLGMSKAIAGVLVVLGSLLVIGVLTLVYAAVREGSLAPGQTPDNNSKRSARIATATAAGVLALLLFGGNSWWNAEANAYRRSMYRPMSVETSFAVNGRTRTLRFVITDSLFVSRRQTPIMPDHGKLMHMFLINAGEASVLAHLHPLRIAPAAFEAQLPPIPKGKYLLFADVVHESGFQRTLVDTVDVPGESTTKESAFASMAGLPTNAVVAHGDDDDSFADVPSVTTTNKAVLSRGGSIELSLEGNAVANRDLRLNIKVRNADSSAAVLEPYMGMTGHAIVMRDDGSVFMHLHPMGTANMSAQAQLMRRERGDTTRLDSTAMAAAMVAALASADSTNSAGMHAMHDAGGVIAFPAAFPSAGNYRVFFQVKRAGVVETVAFTVPVAK